MSNVESHDIGFMREAITLAQQAESLGEVPVGALIVIDQQIVGRGFNQVISGHDPTAHAEVMAIRDAAASRHNYRLVNATLYVTLEPCTMCVGALIHSRIQRLVYGAPEPKAGAVTSAASLLDQAFYNHTVQVTGGILSADCSALLSDFFKARRALKKAKRNS